jgi:Putative prokaryotic signal transducing protein
LAFQEIAGRLRRPGVADFRFSIFEDVSVQIIKTYSTRVDADLARMTLDAAGIPSQVIGVGTDFEGGAGGVRLVVADEHVEEARRLLKDL